MEYTLEKLRSMLKNHDWYYTYSDSHIEWKKGCDEENEIRKAVEALGKPGEDLHNEFIKAKYEDLGL
jgi:hypothetical protein